MTGLICYASLALLLVSCWKTDRADNISPTPTTAAAASAANKTSPLPSEVTPSTQASQPRSLVPPEKLNSSGVTPIQSNELQRKIDSLEDVFAVSPDGANNFCANDLRRIALSGSGNTLSFSGTIDLTQCMNAYFRSRNSQYSARNCSAKGQIYYFCDRGGLDRFAGKSPTDLETQVLCDGGMFKYLSSGVMTCDYVTLIDGIEHTSRMTDYTELGTSGHAPCSQQGLGGGRFRIVDCVSQTRTEREPYRSANGMVYGNVQTADIEFELANLANLELDAPRKPSFYARGALNFTLGDWQIVFNYVNSSQPPTWVASRGMERMQGIFNYLPNLELVSDPESDVNELVESRRFGTKLFR